MKTHFSFKRGLVSLVALVAVLTTYDVHAMEDPNIGRDKKGKEEESQETSLTSSESPESAKAQGTRYANDKEFVFDPIKAIYFFTIAKEPRESLDRFVQTITHGTREGETALTRILGTSDHLTGIYELYEKALKEDLLTWYDVGLVYQQIIETKNDVFSDMLEMKALECFIKAANRNHKLAICRAGLLYATTKTMEYDPIKAIHWLTLAGIPRHKIDRILGNYKQLQDIHQIYSRALQGDPEALCEVGLLYLSLEDSDEFERKALECFEKAANKNHRLAASQAGLIYANEESIQHNPIKAIYWLTQAGTAQEEIDLILEDNEQLKDVHKLYTRALQRDHQAWYEVGLLYESLEGYGEFEGDALECFENAAKGNHPEAFLKIGDFYHWEDDEESQRECHKNYKRAGEIAKQYEEAGETQKAIALYEKISASLYDTRHKTYCCIEVLFNYGQLLERQGNLDGAALQYTRCLSGNEGYIKTLVWPKIGQFFERKNPRVVAYLESNPIHAYGIAKPGELPHLSNATRIELLQMLAKKVTKVQPYAQGLLGEIYGRGLYGVERNLVEFLRWGMKSRQNAFHEHIKKLLPSVEQPQEEKTPEIKNAVRPLFQEIDSLHYRIVEIPEKNETVPPIFQPLYLSLHSVVEHLVDYHNALEGSPGLMITCVKPSQWTFRGLNKQSSPNFLAYSADSRFLSIGEKNADTAHQLVTYLGPDIEKLEFPDVSGTLLNYAWWKAAKSLERESEGALTKVVKELEPKALQEKEIKLPDLKTHRSVMALLSEVSKNTQAALRKVGIVKKVHEAKDKNPDGITFVHKTLIQAEKWLQKESERIAGLTQLFGQVSEDLKQQIEYGASARNERFLEEHPYLRPVARVAPPPGEEDLRH